MNKTLLTTVLFLLTLLSSPAGANGEVKKSKSNICHTPGSTYYSRTKKYTPYKTLEDCLKSGGRRPKA